MPVVAAAELGTVELLSPSYLLTVEQYHAMIRHGIIEEDDRVELLDGLLITKEDRSPAHCGTIMVTEKRLRDKLPAGWLLRIKGAITLDRSEPEPDITVVDGPIRAYLERHPTREDTRMVIEVSDLTLVKDRKKAIIYARNRIPIYWIINLPDTHVEVYTDPSGPDALPAYRQRRDYGRGQAVPVILEGRDLGVIAVDDLLP